MNSHCRFRRWFSRISYFSMASFVTVCIGGCQQQQSNVGTATTGGLAHEHDNLAHDLSYAEAVKKIKKLRDSIRKAFTDGKQSEADGAVHEIGHLLEEIAELATHEQLADEVVNEIKQAADRAFEAYSQLDEFIHGTTDAINITYDDVAEDIESGIATLEVKLDLIDADVVHDHDEHQGHDDDHDHAE